MRAFVIVGTILMATLLRGSEPHTPKELIGDWLPQKIQTQGRVIPDMGSYAFRFTDKQFIWRNVSDKKSLCGDSVFDCIAIENDGLSKIDFRWARENNKSICGPLNIVAIFKIEGDKLTVCYIRNADGTLSDERPAEFRSTEQQGSELLELYRTKVPN